MAAGQKLLFNRRPKSIYSSVHWITAQYKTPLECSWCTCRLFHIISQRHCLNTGLTVINTEEEVKMWLARAIGCTGKTREEGMHPWTLQEQKSVNRRLWGPEKEVEVAKETTASPPVAASLRFIAQKGKTQHVVLTLYFFSWAPFVCRGNVHSALLKGLEIENGNSAMMCCAWVTHNAAKHDYDGSSAILWSKCVPVHMFNLDSGACRWEQKVCFWSILILCLLAQKNEQTFSLCFEKYLMKILIEQKIQTLVVWCRTATHQQLTVHIVYYSIDTFIWCDIRSWPRKVKPLQIRSTEQIPDKPKLMFVRLNS